MARFVSFKIPAEEGSGPPFIVVNPDHVALIEPLATKDQARCRLWLALPSDTDGMAFWRDVLGTLKDVGMRLQDPPSQPATGDPLGTHHRD